MHFLIVTTSFNVQKKKWIRSQILERLNIGQYWNINGIQVFINSGLQASIILMLTILEQVHGPV